MPSFDKNFAIEKLNALIAQHADVLTGCGDPEIENYAASAPWAVGLARYNKIDETFVVKALIVFDFQWGEEFRIQNKRGAGVHDWTASYYDRANAFADLLGALKPFDGQKEGALRGEYQRALDAGLPADGDLPPIIGAREAIAELHKAQELFSHLDAQSARRLMTLGETMIVEVSETGALNRGTLDQVKGILRSVNETVGMRKK